MKSEQKNLFLWLTVFNEVIKQGSFTAAAEKLSLTKSGVSQHVSHLEQYFDVQLLIRSTRSLSLTAAGKGLFKRSEELKTLLDITIDEVNNSKQQPAGRLSITAPQALLQSLVLPAIQQLLKRFPDIDPHLIVDDSNQDIVKDGIDIAIRVGELKDSDLKAKKLGEQRDMFVASTRYLAASDEPITIENLTQHPFIATSWQTIDKTFRLFDHKNNIVENAILKPKFDVNNAHTALELVILDSGIALLPDTYVKQYIQSGQLQHVLGHLHTKPDNIYYVHAYKRNIPLKAKWFLEFLSRQL